MAVAAMLGIGAACYLVRPGSPSLSAGPATSSQPPARAAAPLPRPAAGAASASVPSAPASASSAPASPARKQPARLQDDVALLAGIDSPMTALAAFHAIEKCVEFQRNESKQWDRQKETLRDLTAAERGELAAYCAAMTETMKRDRLAYLEKAVRGGVPGAAVAFAGAGPFGDPGALQTRPDDPLVKEWKKQAAGYLAAGAHGGDIGVLMYLHGQDEMAASLGVPPLLRRAAAVAAVRILAEGTPGAAGTAPVSAELLDGAASMDKVQIAAANAMADDLVAAYKQWREDIQRRER